MNLAKGAGEDGGGVVVLGGSSFRLGGNLYPVGLRVQGGHSKPTQAADGDPRYGFRGGDASQAQLSGSKRPEGGGGGVTITTVSSARIAGGKKKRSAVI